MMVSVYLSRWEIVFLLVWNHSDSWSFSVPCCLWMKACRILWFSLFWNFTVIMPWFVSFFTHCSRSLLCFFSVETCILQFWELFFFIDLLSFSLSLLLEVLLFECWPSWTNLLLFVLFSVSFCSFFFFCHNHVTCRLLVPWAGIEPAPPTVDV